MFLTRLSSVFNTLIICFEYVPRLEAQLRYLVSKSFDLLGDETSIKYEEIDPAEYCEGSDGAMADPDAV